MKNYGIVLIRETGDTSSTHWKVPANSPEEAREKLIDFVKNDKGQKEFEKALGCGFPYRTDYVGFCDDYVENHCKDMTSENLRKDYLHYAWVCANHEYYNNDWRDTSLMKYCEKHGIQYKNRSFEVSDKIKIELELTREEIEKLYWAIQRENSDFCETMIQMENEGYREGNETTKAMYAVQCKWQKFFRNLAEDIKKYTDIE